MNKRERALSVGYLVKSPTRNTDKASFSKFWKLRWCVFVEIIYKQSNESKEEKKLILYYYKNKESHQRDEPAKGNINITNCENIKSCYQSQAGFEHIFVIECDGKVVKFSAPSCQKKFKWITMLLNHKQNAIMPQENVGSPFTSQVQVRRNRSIGNQNKRMSGCFEEMISFQQREENKEITRRMSVSSHFGNRGGAPCRDPKRDWIKEPPPLPPRRDTGNSDLSSMLEHQLSICNRFSDKLELQSPRKSIGRQKPVAVTEADKEFGLLQIFNDLFMLCETCQKEAGKKAPGLKRRPSSKQRRNTILEDEHAEIKYEGKKMPDADSVSQDTASSGESVSAEINDEYSEINEEFLQKFRERIASVDVKADEMKKEENRRESIKEENTTQEDEEFIYEDMNCIASPSSASEVEEKEHLGDTLESKGIPVLNDQHSDKVEEVVVDTQENQDDLYQSMNHRVPLIPALQAKEKGHSSNNNAIESVPDCKAELAEAASFANKNPRRQKTIFQLTL